MHQTFLHRYELEIAAHFLSKNNLLFRFSTGLEEPVRLKVETGLYSSAGEVAQGPEAS